MSNADRRPAELLDLRGTEVAYRSQGAGETILYLHGLGMTRRWLPIHQELSQLGRLVAPEHPGFGGSALPEWMSGFDDLVLHYAELADALDLGSFHLVGHSFGGWVAAELAAFYPERVRSLTLISPWGLRVAGNSLTDVFRMSYEGFVELCFNGRLGDAAELVYEDDELETLLESYSERTALAKFMWNPRYDHRLDRRLGRIKVPSLVLAAEEDRVVPEAHCARYAELLGARLETITGDGGPTGHALVVQEPTRVAAEVASLIGAT